MPYIKDLRKELSTGEVIPTTPGELNYVITELCHRYIHYNGGLRYKILNEIVGVLECAKLELYRQVIAPYESQKKLENGAISNLDNKTLEDVR